MRAELQERLASRYDEKLGGWGYVHKFLDWDAVEYCLERARRGDARALRMARETLDRQLGLLDPVWGGVYQYSDSGDWEHPHFEKIMSMQAENLRLYALAYGQWGEARHLAAARAIERYLSAFLSGPDGVFYTSQDADLVPGEHSGEYFALPDAERRRRGLPRVDTHQYARENAWAANALLALYAQTGERRLLERALLVGGWLLRERGLPGGGFRHDTSDTAGPYLGDSAAALRLFLALYSASSDRGWLERASATADFVGRTFATPDGRGLRTAATPGAALPELPQRDENTLVARAAGLLFHYTGEPRHRRLAEAALAFLAEPAVARRPEAGGVLLADAELLRDPLHVTVVGAAGDESAQALLLEALGDPRGDKRVELWDKQRGPLPRADVSYPQLARPAAFVCSAGRCSSPSYTPEELGRRLAQAAGGP